MFRMFRIRPLTTDEESIIEQAREIRAERRREMAKVISEAFANLLATMVIVAGIVGFFDIINKIEWRWVPTLWVLASTFVVGAIVTNIAADVPEPSEPELDTELCPEA